MTEDIKKAFEKACDESAIDRYIKLFNIIKGNLMKEDPKMIVCPECGGDGIVKVIQEVASLQKVCPTCLGKGKIEPKLIACPECNNGFITRYGPIVCGVPCKYKISCPACHGTGKIEKGDDE